MFPDTRPSEEDLELAERVEELLASRVDLNEASFEDLLAIPWLSPLLARQIVRTRESLGTFDSVGQLRIVPGLTDEWLQALRPVVTIAAAGPRTGRASRLGMPGRVDLQLQGGTDSAAAVVDPWRVFGRIGARSGRLQATALIEKDAHDQDLWDFVSVGARLDLDRVDVTVGHMVVGFGQGLVFSSPYSRGTGLLAGAANAGYGIRLSGSATEAAPLRGLGIGAVAGPWRFALFGSSSPRDARLNGDGTVARLRLDGVHDDSAARAERRTLPERTFGTIVSVRRSDFNAGVVAGGCSYGRSFAPVDSSSSFYGSLLGFTGVCADAIIGPYTCGVEVAGSLPRGLAGALRLDGRWRSIGTSLSVRWRQQTYSAPHGRWLSLTDRRERLDLSGRINYRSGGLELGIRGNTWRDYSTDSLPARIELDLGQTVGILDFGLELGRRYRGETQRSRTGRLSVKAKLPVGTDAAFLLGDEYPDSGTGRGRFYAIQLRGRWRAVQVSLSGARFDIAGSGISMYISAPGVMRIGASYGTSVSAWHTRATAGVGFARVLRLGVAAGVEWKEAANLDLGLRLDAGIGS